jgi:hypothetical protein
MTCYDHKAHAKSVKQYMLDEGLSDYSTITEQG